MSLQYIDIVIYFGNTAFICAVLSCLLLILDGWFVEGEPVFPLFVVHLLLSVYLLLFSFVGGGKQRVALSIGLYFLCIT
jgi:hypothetical protein